MDNDVAKAKRIFSTNKINVAIKPKYIDLI